MVRVPLYVHTPADGSAVVVPVQFPDLAVEGPDPATATGLALGRLRERVAALSAVQRNALRQVRRAALDRAEVELVIDDEPVRLAVAVAIVTRETADGDVHLVQAPALPGFTLVVRREDEAVSRAVPKLARTLSRQPVAVALAAHERGAARLEWVEVDVPGADAASPGAATANPLDQFGERLTGRVAAGPGRLDLGDGLVERVLAALATPERSSVMLVGPREVGKTALLHEIARRLTQGTVPPALHGRELWRVAANDLVAGARYTGMWQERGRLLVTYARRTPVVYAMGDPLAIVDVGRWSESDNNLGRQLRPHVERGELTLVCECTAEELSATRDREPGFVDAFQRVDVPEPTPAQTQTILEHAARRLGEAQGLEVDPGAVPAALELTRRFEPYRGLPGKAVRLLEETVRSVAGAGGRSAARADVVSTFTARTGLPLALLSDDVALRSAEVTEFFEARVLGQQAAVGAVTDLVMVLKAALNDPEKPLGTLLFAGPTGVGKTELAKALAEYLFGSRERLVRLDMAEYGTADAVQRLAGTTWRRHSDGELTRRVREQPFCVVLLDEIEKAHSTAFDALLSVTGEGRLTDAAGRTADFRNAIIIMTSNLGASRQGSTGLGFLAADSIAAADRVRRHYVAEAERFFRPEFFNRLDRVVVFHPLQEETVRRIARREVGRLLLREGIVRRQLLVEVDDAAVDVLARRGFHPTYGARPLQREIERTVIHPLARLLGERSPRPGDLVHVRAAGGGLAVELERVTVPDRAPGRSEAGGAGQSEAPRPADATLARTAAAATRLDETVTTEEAGAVAQALRAEVSLLVARTNGPEFWDDAGAARATMSRIYQLQRVLDDLEALRERTTGLAELARRMRSARDRRRLPEVRAALTDIEARLELVRLELAGAAVGGGSSPALVRATPLSPDGEGWARELVEMYAAWATRTGREVERVEPGEPGDSPAVRISGLASHELLAAESGLHRRLSRDGRTLVARLTVTPAAGPAAVAEETGAGGQGIATVVRVYDDGKRQVRDPRTGVQVRDPEAVLREGRVDAFLLGSLQPDGPAAGWQRPAPP